LNHRGAKQKAADSFLAAFFMRPLEGREEPNEALEACENSPVDYSSERRDDALAEIPYVPTRNVVPHVNKRE